MKTVTYGYNQFCSEYFAYDLATNSKYGSLPTGHKYNPRVKATTLLLTTPDVHLI